MIDPTGEDFSDLVNSYNKMCDQTHATIEDYGAELVQNENYVGAAILAFAQTFVPRDSMDAALSIVAAGTTVAGKLGYQMSLGGKATLAVGQSVVKDLNSQFGEIATGAREKLNAARTPNSIPPTPKTV